MMASCSSVDLRSKLSDETSTTARRAPFFKTITPSRISSASTYFCVLEATPPLFFGFKNSIAIVFSFVFFLSSSLPPPLPRGGEGGGIQDSCLPARALAAEGFIIHFSFSCLLAGRQGFFFFFLAILFPKYSPIPSFF